jgi:ABC-type phosphate transport system permease subunit
MLQPQPLTPIIIKVVPAPTPEVGVGDILLGSLGLTGVIVVSSFIIGVFLGGLLIAYSRRRANRRGDNDDSTATRLNLSSPSR